MRVEIFREYLWKSFRSEQNWDGERAEWHSPNEINNNCGREREAYGRFTRRGLRGAAGSEEALFWWIGGRGRAGKAPGPNSLPLSCLHFTNKHWMFPRHRWSSGRILACHAGDPGSIPGRCKVFWIFLCFCFFAVFVCVFCCFFQNVYTSLPQIGIFPLEIRSLLLFLDAVEDWCVKLTALHTITSIDIYIYIRILTFLRWLNWTLAIFVSNVH